MSQENTQKVAWIREQQFSNGVTASVSEKTGIVKVAIPDAGRRAVMLYRDELMALLGQSVAIQNFLKANEDVIFSKDQSKEARQIKRQQTKALTTAVETLHALGKSQDEIEAFLNVKIG